MFDTILGIVTKFIPDANKAKEITLKVEEEFTKQMKLKSEIIMMETKNGSGLWRVRLMYLCMAMVASHFIMYEVIPYFNIILDWNLYTPEAPESEHLWSFLKIGVGGYIGSRGLEKSIAHWRK